SIEGCRGAGGGDCQIKFLCTYASGDTMHLLRDELAQTRNFKLLRRIMQQEFLREPYCSQRQAEHGADMSMIGDGQLAASATQIEHDHHLVRDRHIRKHSEMDQASFFQS